MTRLVTAFIAILIFAGCAAPCPPAPTPITLPQPTPMVVQLPAPTPTIITQAPKACYDALWAADAVNANTLAWLEAMSLENYDKANTLSDTGGDLLEKYWTLSNACRNATGDGSA